jgi:spermidine synthase
VVNALVGLWSTHLFRRELGDARGLRAAAVAVLAALGVGLWGAERVTTLAEENLYADEVIFARDTRYQRVVLTAWKDDLRLFLNGHLQFSSRDEYRYHEALVHPGLAALPGARRVLVLGGGDGLAAREVLRYPGVREVVLVDLDAEVTGLFARHPRLRTLNGGSLTDPRVRVVNADAFRWLEDNGDLFDFVVVDFPDPSNYAVGKLYTVAFYELLKRHLRPGGLFAVQSTSPLFARQTYWGVVATLRAARLGAWPYHLYVPSFGEWGFVLAGDAPNYAPPARLPAGLRYLTLGELGALFRFAPDMAEVPAAPNRLNDQALVRTYEAEWGRINR